MALSSLGLLFAAAAAALSSAPKEDIIASEDSPVFSAPEVSDAELADNRGGISLPGGIDVSMAVETETSVDGNLLLRSVFKVDNGAPTLQVFAPSPGQVVPSHPAPAGAAGTAVPGAVSVTFDRQNGVTIVSTGPVIAANVTVTTGGAPQADSGSPTANLQPLDLSNGAVQAAGGQVSVQQLPTGPRIQLQGEGIDVSHVFGNAIGAVLINNANDRAIESATTIGLDLRNATPLNLGSSLLRIDDLAADAMRTLVVR